MSIQVKTEVYEGHIEELENGHLNIKLVDRTGKREPLTLGNLGLPESLDTFIRMKAQLEIEQLVIGQVFGASNENELELCDVMLTQLEELKQKREEETSSDDMV